MRKLALVSIVLTIIGFFSGCASQVILDDKNPPPVSVEETPEKIVDDFEDRLASVKTAGFEFIYAFRRKDGDIFTSEDKKFLKENSPADTNQWVMTADKKAVIAGSNYPFSKANLEALRKRFKTDDYLLDQ